MKECDIRPDGLFQTFLDLCAKDAENFFSDCSRTDIPCPGCGHASAAEELVRWGFPFAVCLDCGSLYQTPRPEMQSFFDFYQQGESARYWSTVFLPAVQEQRRKYLFQPKVQELNSLCAADGYTPQTVVDVGAGFGLFLEEWRKFHPDGRTIALEPHPDMAQVCREKGLEVVEAFAETAAGLHGEADLVTSFEVLEHTYDSLDFCLSIRKLLRPGGRALFTTLTSTGFDIQVLWERSKSISPPQHLNLLSIQGLTSLMQRAGFRDISIFTPGKLDVDIVANAIREKDLPPSQRFVKEILKTEESRVAFQKYLQEQNLSSHCWIWVRA